MSQLGLFGSGDAPAAPPEPEGATRFVYIPGAELELIRRVRARLAAPERWCQRVTARDAAGLPVDPMSQRAVRWDIGGAFTRERADGAWGVPLRVVVVFDRLLSRAPWVRSRHEPCARWQDRPDRTHAEVLALLDAVAAELGGP